MTPASITQWLKQPGSAIDAADLEAISKAYPYFVPARYMEAAARHGVKPFAPPMLATIQLYMGNWLLFYQILETAGIPLSPLPEPETPIQQPPLLPAPAETPEALLVADNNAGSSLIQPVFTEDYFRHQGVAVAGALPEEPEQTVSPEPPAQDDPQSLLVVMSFSDWLMHFKTKSKKEKEEEQDRKALKTMWQKEKLAAALEEENDEIPENVFEMAVNSITKEDDLASESLAEIMLRQGKPDKAIDMYRKLSLRNPRKSVYFAQQIALIQKNSDA